MSVFHPPSLVVSQNFLKDPRLVARLIDRCAIGPEDMVYEIGPGKGIITSLLARRCRQVIAIEKDPALSEGLRKKLSHYPNLTLRTGDFLHDRLPREPYKVFSNIPFNISSAIVARLTSAANPPEDTCLVLQKEAAEVYLGKPHETLRSVLLKPWFEPMLVHHFRRTDFAPPPHVDPVLLRMRKRSPPWIDRANRQGYRDFVTYCFTTWRPTLGDIFQTVFSHRQLRQIEREMNINLGSTPTRLGFDGWLSLYETWINIRGPQTARLVSGSERRLLCQQQKLHKLHRTRKR
jgi:23S rRNA (adenine-N6)-dimethyltransferase